jgi:hypothetical protein
MLLLTGEWVKTRVSGTRHQFLFPKGMLLKLQNSFPGLKPVRNSTAVRKLTWDGVALGQIGKKHYLSCKAFDRYADDSQNQSEESDSSLDESSCCDDFRVGTTIPRSGWPSAWPLS